MNENGFFVGFADVRRWGSDPLLDVARGLLSARPDSHLRRRLTMRKTLAVASILAAASLAGTAHATPTNSKEVQVQAVMCAASKLCTAYVVGVVANTTGCSRYDAVKWDASTPQGQNMLSLFQAAHLSGRKVVIWDEGCTQEWPTLQYVKVL
jgi:hypothetical protein